MFFSQIVINILHIKSNKMCFFSGGAEEFDEVEEDAELDEIDQPEVHKPFFNTI